MPANVLPLAQVTQHCWAFVSAINESTSSDPLDDRRVCELLDHFRSPGLAPRVSQMLAAWTCFAFDQLRLAQGAMGQPPVTLHDLEAQMESGGSIDAQLIADVFAIARAIEPPRVDNCLRAAIGIAITTWGPYALATQAYVILRIARSMCALRHGPTLTVDALLRRWAQRDEQQLRERDKLPHQTPSPADGAV